MNKIAVIPAPPIDTDAPHADNLEAVNVMALAAWPIAGSGLWGVHVFVEQGEYAGRWSLNPLAYIVRRPSTVSDTGEAWMAVLPGAPGGDQGDAMHFEPQETPEEAFSLILAEIDV